MGAADDRRFMARALELSRRNTGLTGTNPSVGCVIVKDGEVVGEAVTAPGGRPHAETQALENAGEKARGATAYVTLEPCSHYGRTPPCANALVEAGVARVVVSLTDPDPRVSGRGLAILREAGIAVESGLMQDEGRRALAGYLMRQTRGRPYVTLKLAVSANGKLGRRGEEVSITGPDARNAVHRLRAQSDAILVGIGTALSDDPELTVRIPGLEDRSPVRIVLDRRLQLPPESKLVRTAKDVPVIVVASSRSIMPRSTMPDGTEGDEPVDRRKALEGSGVEIMDSSDLDVLLAVFAARGISSLLVEGGALVAKAFLDAGLVDRILLFQGTGVVGTGGLESPVTPSDMPQEFKLIREEAFGPDRCFEYERGF
ncbi:bifunctional diaminohydroxyphosphoribosylaminopyrimidine deaminase/5-amino-6-(5-phosphoribosylamino)uracil reductase RibD [Rhizobium puerariae]|uniref:Riboflavin biosynthesis protein RibD n=1 Tax=Rhizobium puerariae TaxID=1585791 RepID=A0ABV6AN21_9HYPH